MDSCACLRFRLLDCSEDIRICTATADVTAHPFPDLLVAVGVIFFYQGDCGTDLSGRAIAALKPVVLDKSGLHWMQLLAVGQSFDRRDFIALVHDRECKTRVHAAAIDQNRARAALAVIASFFRASQMQPLAQGVE